MRPAAGSTPRRPPMRPARRPCAFGAAMVPVLFAYGGWQTASFVSGEIKDPTRTLPRALLFGVAGVIALYVAVSGVCLRVLGPQAPGRRRDAGVRRDARRARRNGGHAHRGRHCHLDARLPEPGDPDRARVYFAMARDGLFFRRWPPRSTRRARADCRHRPAGDARHDHRVVGSIRADPELCRLGRLHLLRPHGGGAADLRRRAERNGEPPPRFRVPGHPITTIGFVLVGVAGGGERRGALSRPTPSSGSASLLAGVPVVLCVAEARRQGLGD